MLVHAEGVNQDGCMISRKGDARNLSMEDVVAMRTTSKAERIVRLNVPFKKSAKWNLKLDHAVLQNDDTSSMLQLESAGSSLTEDAAAMLTDS